MKKIILVLIVVFNMLAASANGGGLAIERSGSQIELHLLGIVCDFCARALEKVFGRQEEVKSISVDLDTNIMIVNLKQGQNLSDQQLTKLIEDSGYKIEEKE